jgi:hypothetical protein
MVGVLDLVMSGNASGTLQDENVNRASCITGHSACLQSAYPSLHPISRLAGTCSVIPPIPKPIGLCVEPV